MAFPSFCMTSMAMFGTKYVKVFHISPRDFYKEVCRSLDLSLSEKSRQSMITGIQERATQLKEQGIL